MTNLYKNIFSCVCRLGVIINCSGAWFNTIKALLKNICTNPRTWWNQRKRNSKTSSSKKLPYSNRSDNSPPALTSNISLPQTGEEAMKRLFACKGKDPYRLVLFLSYRTLLIYMILIHVIRIEVYGSNVEK